MAIGPTGVDSSVVVTQRLITQAGQNLGSAPEFWGRYFKGPGNTDPVQYQTSEAPIFRSNSLRILPVARQTNVVDGDEATGDSFGTTHASGFIKNIGVNVLKGQSDAFYLFLDVEPRGDGPALSKDFYTGWSKAVQQTADQLSGGQFTILPGVYLNSNDGDTSTNLQAAIQGGAYCAALWIARGTSSSLQPPQFSAAAAPKTDVDAPVVLWQYFLSDNGVDGDELNPFYLDVLKHLAVP